MARELAPGAFFHVGQGASRLKESGFKLRHFCSRTLQDIPAQSRGDILCAVIAALAVAGFANTAEQAHALKLRGGETPRRVAQMQIIFKLIERSGSPREITSGERLAYDTVEAAFMGDPFARRNEVGLLAIVFFENDVKAGHGCNFYGFAKIIIVEYLRQPPIRLVKRGGYWRASAGSKKRSIV